MSEWAETSLSLVIALVLTAGAIEKIRLLVRGTARWHPALVSSKLRRRFAGHLVAVALLADAATVFSFFFVPWAGLLGAMLLLSLYSAAALTSRAIQRGEPCRCAGWLLEVAGPRALAARNAMLIAIATVLFIRRAPTLAEVDLIPGAVAVVVLVSVSAALHHLQKARHENGASLLRTPEASFGEKA